jgi:TPR repeat protein
VAKDLSEAANWFRKAADQGYPDAQFHLGNSCLNGEGVAKNTSEAVRWYRKAAEQGHAYAQAVMRDYQQQLAASASGGNASSYNNSRRYSSPNYSPPNTRDTLSENLRRDLQNQRQSFKMDQQRRQSQQQQFQRSF